MSTPTNMLWCNSTEIKIVVVHLVVELGWIVVHMMGEACWIVAVNLMGTISVFYLVGWVDKDTVVLYER